MSDVDVPRLEQVAQQLAARVRDEDPVRVWAWLAAELPAPKDWYRLCFVLACAVPDDQTWSELTDWSRPVGVSPGG
jgi:hypothetical protein